jgi:ABC-type lipopolysaccharide export system ATPase subunit
VPEQGRVPKEGDAVTLQQDESIRQLYLGVD